MQVWTGYVLLLGIGLLLIPNVIFSLFGIDDTDEVWIRIAGLLLIGYGAYYWTALQAGFTALIRMSVWVRWGIVVGLIVLAFTVGPWQLVLFASVDLLGGLWTHLALKSESAAAASI
jgi:choline-glycine betaine transporter